MSELQTRMDDLEAEVARLRREKRRLEETVAAARTSSAALLATCEEAQEGISNRLLREIERLRTAQAAMAVAVEAEERQLVGALQRRMDAMRHEKVDIENALEKEQERIVNLLQRQMDDLRSSLSMPTEGGLSARLSSIASLSRPGTPPSLPHAVVPGSPALSSVSMASLPSHPTERESELQRQLAKALADNQTLVFENVQLKNRMRRQSLDGTGASLAGASSSSSSSAIFSPALGASLDGRATFSDVRHGSHELRAPDATATLQQKAGDLKEMSHRRSSVLSTSDSERRV